MLAVLVLDFVTQTLRMDQSINHVTGPEPKDEITSSYTTTRTDGLSGVRKKKNERESKFEQQKPMTRSHLYGHPPPSRAPQFTVVTGSSSDRVGSPHPRATSHSHTTPNSAVSADGMQNIYENVRRYGIGASMPV